MVNRMTMQTAHIPSLSILTFPRMSDGKVLLPVRPSYALMTSFRHITVIPDPSQVNNIPLYKLNALDSLLDQLAGPGRQAGKVTVDAGSIDGLLSVVSAKVLSRSASPYRTGLASETGGILDLVA
jgi:hypothetical protein